MRYAVIAGEHGKAVQEIRLRSRKIAIGIADLLIHDLDKESGRVEVYDFERDSERPIWALTHTK